MRLGKLPLHLVGTILGAAFQLLSILSAFLWPLCSANLYISLPSEKRLYFVSLSGVALGALLINRFRRQRTTLGLDMGALAMTASAVMSVLVISATWQRNNDLFLYWVTRTTPDTVWSELGKQMDAFAAGLVAGAPTDYVQLSRKDLPPYFDKTLGRRSDFYLGSASKYKDGPPLVMVVYGYKTRCWGLYRGGNPKERWPDAKVIRINADTWYFLATNL